MQLSKVQHRVLEAYRRSRNKPPTMWTMLRRIAKSYAVYTVLIIVGAVIIFLIDTSSFKVFGVGVAGVLVGILLGTIRQNLAYLHRTVQLWPILEQLLDWERIEQLLDESNKE